MNGVQTVISLLEPQETSELRLTNEESLCLKYNMKFINYPIPDRGLPKDQQTVKNLIDELRNRLRQGEKLVFHCRMGIGRSSIIAAATLLKEGEKADDIFDKIGKIRELKVPDTDD